METTAVANLINSPTTSAAERANNIEQAAKNGMSIEQLAASRIACGNKAVLADSAAMTVLKSKEPALAAFDRIAAIPACESGSSYIPTDQLITAIKG